MDIKKLFSGVAVIIDNKINDEESGDLIINIMNKLRTYNIPLIKYLDIPENKTINSLKNVNFVLLDWELFDSHLSGTRTEIKYINRNIAFIKKLRKTTFVPIFIFSNLSKDSIINILKERKLYKDNYNNCIFVKRKSDLFSKDKKKFVFWSELTNWLNRTPSIYVLKEWENSLDIAKTDLFWSFYDINQDWPSVLQETFTKDGSDVNYELGNFVFKNIMARIEPIKFDDEIIKKEGSDISKEDIRKILEAERFIKNESLPKIPFTGDLYKKSPDGKNYLLNIRPECDIIRKNNPSLYCIEGTVIDETMINSTKEENKNKKITFDNGFIEKTNELYLPFVDNGKILKFSLKNITTNKKWNDLKEKRLGRLLPPYITRVQQRYSFYLQRQGLPAIPEKAIFGYK